MSELNMLPRARLSSSVDYANVLSLDMGATPMILEMRRTGMLIDSARLSAVEAQARREKDILEKQIHDVVGRCFNIDSDDQLAEVLFGDLGLSSRGLKRAKKKKRPSVAKDELEKLNHLHPVVQQILDYSQRSTLINNFLTVLPAYIRSDGRIYPDYRVTRVPSGRLACRNPNLMAIPVKSELGREIRDCFVAPEGWCFAAADYSQIEMRVMGHVSRDAALSDCFLAGDDIHWRTAEAVYQKPRDQLDKLSNRNPCKSCGFGIIYGITAVGLLNQIISRGGDREYWNEEKTQKLIDQWFDIYGGVWRWILRERMQAKKTGLSVDMFGRPRKVAGVWSAHERVVEETYRFCGNHPIQSGAQGIIKLAMLDLWEVAEELRRKWGDVIRFALQIHDELVTLVKEEVKDEWLKWMLDVMETVVELSVPVKCDGALGRTWKELKT